MDKNCAISVIQRAAAVVRNNQVEATTITGTIFQLKNAKLYVSVVFLSINDNIKVLEHFHIFHSFSKTALFINLKKNLFQNHFLLFFLDHHSYHYMVLAKHFD